MNTLERTLKPKAYSYARFSTPEQIRGDSLRRQSERAFEYAAKNGLELDQQTTFQDLGVSAFRGANAETGRLGEFLEAVRSGLIKPGSYLLIENLDRLSRNKPRKAVRLLENIVEMGITVVTLTDGKEYTDESLDDDPMSFMWAFLVAVRGHEESARKSGHLKAAWSSKRAKADHKILTAKAPAWLLLREDRSGFEIIEERAAVVRRIFELARSGVGQNKIAQLLNRDGVKPFGNGKMWRRSNIAKLLAYEGVIGTFVPHTIEEGDERRKYRRPTEPIKGYYPAVIPVELWSDVQALKRGALNPQRGRHQTITNVLGGLAICASCGGTATKVNKGKGWQYLVCARAKVGAGCDYDTSVYREVESAVLDRLSDYLADVPLGEEGGKLDAELEDAEAALDALQEEANNLMEEIASRRSAGLSEKLRATEEELEQANKGLDELKKKRDALSSAFIQQRVQVLHQALKEKSGIEKVNVCLRMVFDAVVIDRATGLLEFKWKQGGPPALVPYSWPKSTVPKLR